MKERNSNSYMVEKRDGQIVDFSIDKITAAVTKAVILYLVTLMPTDSAAIRLSLVAWIAQE